MNPLRERAWWLIRQHPTFTLNDLLTTLCDGSEKNAYISLMKYVGLLERVGVLVRLKRREPGTSALSRGRVIWRMVQDLGRLAPVARYADTIIYDPNSKTELTAELLAVMVSKQSALPEKAQRVRDARQAIVSAINQIKLKERCFAKRAIDRFLEEAHAGRISADLVAHLSMALSPIGKRKVSSVFSIPSRRTLERWMRAKDLSPKHHTRDREVTPWMLKALQIRRRIPHATYTGIHERLVKGWNSEWGGPISQSALRRFLRNQLQSVPLSKARQAEAQAMSGGRVQ